MRHLQILPHFHFDLTQQLPLSLRKLSKFTFGSPPLSAAVLGVTPEVFQVDSHVCQSWIR